MGIKRLECYDCGCHLKRKKAIEHAVMDDLGNNVCRIFCSSCAKKRGLSKIDKNKTTKILKSVVRLAIVIIPVIFWRWFENDIRGWGGGILTVGTLVIIFLFMLYDNLE